MVIDVIVRRRRIIAGLNSDQRRFGRHRDPLFTAYFCGPLIVGVENDRGRRVRLGKAGATARPG